MSSRVGVVSAVLSLGIIVVGIGTFVVWSQHSGRFPLNTIEVRAELKHVRDEDIKARVLPLLSRGFFGLNVKSIQDSLECLPWVHTAEIRRVWPDRLLIQVEEKKAQAKWGEKGVLSTDGIIFYPDPANIPAKLPQFDSPDDRVKEVVEQYLTLLELLSPVGLSIQRLSLSKEGTWQMTLDNGMAVVLGKAGINERMARFILAYQSKLQNKIQEIAYIDLRYTTGFAIGWKAGVK